MLTMAWEKGQYRKEIEVNEVEDIIVRSKTRVNGPKILPRRSFLRLKRDSQTKR